MIERFNDEIDIGSAFQLANEVERLQGRYARLCLDAGAPSGDDDARARAEAERRRVGAALAKNAEELRLIRSGIKRI